MKTFDVGMNPRDSALSHQFIPSVNTFTPSCAVFHSLPQFRETSNYILTS